MALVSAGATSLRCSSHLPPISGSKAVKPVRLPPGRPKLSTNPLPTGSPTDTNTTGIDRSTARIAITAGLLQTTISSGAAATSSNAADFNRFKSLVACR